MKAIIIPSILAATVLVAGMFAFMPVEKASTVHTTIQSTIGEARSVIGDGITFSVADGTGPDEKVILAAGTGKVFTGHMAYIISANSATSNPNHTVKCEISPGVFINLNVPTALDDTGDFMTANFSCLSLKVSVAETGIITATSTVDYVTFKEISQITTDTTGVP